MKYSYDQVSKLALAVADCLKRPIHLGTAHHNWQSAVAEINSTGQTLRHLDLNFLNYVRALARAKYYLETDKNALKDVHLNPKHDLLDKKIKWCVDMCNHMKANYPMHYGRLNLEFLTSAPITHTPARSTVTSVESVVAQVSQFIPKCIINGTNTAVHAVQKASAQMDSSPEVKAFINSEAFKRLVNYNNTVLKNDIRDHSFWGFNLRVNKSEILKKFTDKLECAINIDDVKKVFEDLNYGRNGFFGAYQTLNTGQNITTRFFGSLGMKTTTIKLIDELRNTLPAVHNVTGFRC